MYRRFLGAACLLVLGLSGAVLWAQSDQGQKPKQEEFVEVKLESEGIRVVHLTRYFFAPYQVQSGETLQSISKKFYGTEDQAEMLAKVAGLSPQDALNPGTTVYIVVNEFLLKWSGTDAENQMKAVRAFLQGTSDRKFRYQWSDADMSIDFTKNVLTSFDVAEFRLLPASADRPVLVLKFPKKPALRVFLGEAELSSATTE
ncbi:MAG TPA: LysM domain-containing protein [Terriglobales bacterium]|nr:LysM domain-containing protein [Terriglobales bacterium]